jgi:hypothetical protein
MEQTYQDPSGFSIKYPAGWAAFRHNSGAAVVTNLQELAFVVIQELSKPLPGTERDILAQLQFPAAVLLAQPKVGPIESPAPGIASCYVNFKFPSGAPGQAVVTCEKFMNGAIVTVCAAQDLKRIGPVMWLIRRSYTGDKIRTAPELFNSIQRGTPAQYDDMPAPPQTAPPQPTRPAVAHTVPPPPRVPQPPRSPQPPPPAQPQALRFNRYTDPQAGTFTIDIPEGWQVRGGFSHPGLGDRRTFAEVRSPQGISVLLGDPDCPQAFYENPMAWGQGFITYPTGCVFLNLKCSGKNLAAWYLKNVAPQRFGPIQTGAEADRKDIAETNKKWHPDLAGFQATAHQVALRAANRSGRLLAFSFSTGGIWGVGDNWSGNVLLWLAPQGLENIGEQVAMRMLQSLQFTPRLAQIFQQDEAMISGNGNIALANQQQWFAGQQAAHRAQVQAGDIQVAGYWDQQRANDRMMASWEQNQQVNGDLAQRWGDAMLGNQRLYDETIGKEYNVAAGSNYYWVDNGGNVVGTNTETPPDYLKDYRLLKKL